MGCNETLMLNCSLPFVGVHDCSSVFGLLATVQVFATVLSIYNEQLNSSPLRIPLQSSSFKSPRDLASLKSGRARSHAQMLHRVWQSVRRRLFGIDHRQDGGCSHRSSSREVRR